MVKNVNKFVLASAPGKCILFGEHSVVYGYPAISMGISIKSTCQIEKINTNKIQVNLKNFNKNFEFKDVNQLLSKFPSKFSQIQQGIKLIAEKSSESIHNIKIILSSSILPGSGLGSSASIAVAMITAFNEFYQLQMNKYDISKNAFEMEKIIHGTPSGIDNTTCTFGNLIYFKNKKFEKINISYEFNILLVYTGIKHNTRIVIKRIQRIKDQFPDITKQTFNSMGDIADKAKLALENNDLIKVGMLMNSNQVLLSSLNVSNSIIAEINGIAKDKGAFGSKLTGAGLGGYVIIIGNNLNSISQTLNNRGFKTFLVGINREGAKIEEKREY